MYDRKFEEYAADFILIARRTLDDAEYRLFKFHYLLGADWKLCCARLRMDRGSFFHAVYRVQQKLGRAFRETQPYGIFPVYQYFEDERRESQDAKQSRLAARPGENDQGRPESPRISPRRMEEANPGEQRPSIRGRRIA